MAREAGAEELAPPVERLRVRERQEAHGRAGLHGVDEERGERVRSASLPGGAVARSSALPGLRRRSPS